MRIPSVFYHVTEREHALAILKEGFQGGWGDLGFGVYFYGTITSARAYARRGGWDGELEDPVILQVADASIAQIDASALDPSWDAEDYADMAWRKMDDNAEDASWRPSEASICDLGPIRVQKPRGRRK